MKELHAFLFSRTFALICLVGLAVGLAMPKDGLGISTCGLERITGLPCPACGLTRSVSCFYKGHLTESVRYHAMGPIFALGITLFGMLVFLPQPGVEGLRRWFDRSASFWFWCYMGLFVVFLMYGLLRLLNVWASPEGVGWFRGNF